MILWCDENIGTAVPRALASVGYRAHALYDLGGASRPDVDWLVQAGRERVVVFSCDKKMLKVPNEKQTIIDERVGIVFLTSGQEKTALVLKMLLSRWSRMEELDNTTPRPFARFVTPNGIVRLRFGPYSGF